MATDSDNKLTRYTSAVTVVTAEVMNALYGGEYGYNTEAGEHDPVVAGHVHDGIHADGHASKVLLTNGSHVRGVLSHQNLGGYDGTDPAVQAVNIQCYSESVYGPSGGGHAIPEYTEDSFGDRCYYLDLSMTIGGSDTHVQYNEGGEFGGDAGFVYNYAEQRVGIGTSDPRGKLTVKNDSGTGVPHLLIHEDDDNDGGRILFTNTADNAGPFGDSHEWTLYGESGAGGSPENSAFNLWYGDFDGAGGGSDIIRVIGDGRVGINKTPTMALDVDGSGNFSGDLDVGGKLTVVGLIDPTGLVLSEYDPDEIPTGAGYGALFVSDGSHSHIQNHLHYKDKDGNIVDLLGGPKELKELTDVDNDLAPTEGEVLIFNETSGVWETQSMSASEPDGPDGSIQYRDGDAFAGSGSFYYNKSEGTASDHPVVTISNLDQSNGAEARMTELAFEGIEGAAGDSPAPYTLANIQASHEGESADDKSQLDFNINSGSGLLNAIKVNSNAWVGINPNDGEPLRRLHIRGDDSEIPLRINDLTSGEGKQVLWNSETGDVFYKQQDSGIIPKKKSWPFPGEQDDPEVFDYNIRVIREDLNKLIIIDEEWNQAGHVLIPEIPDPEIPEKPWRHGDFFAIKNRTMLGDQGPVSVLIKSEPDSLDTLDGLIFNNSYTLHPNEAIHLSLNYPEGAEIREWYITAHYHGIEGQEQLANNPPDAGLEVYIDNDNEEDPIVLTSGDSVQEGSHVTFDGTSSFDSDGDVIVSYLWDISVDGVSDDSPPIESLFAIDTQDMGGSNIVVKLKVSDGILESTEASFSLSVASANQAPIINIDEEASTLSIVGVATDTGTVWPGNLYATSSDPDNDSLTYTWTADSVNVSFITPDSEDTEIVIAASGSYEIQVEVDDGNGGIDTDSVTIVANAVNLAPLVDFVFELDAGPVVGINLGDTVTIVPTVSDPENDALVWTWAATAPDSSALDVSEFLTTGESFTYTPSAYGDYSFDLSVSDGNEQTSLTKGLSVNALPIASFSYAPDQGEVLVPSAQINLTSTSSDPDGTIASWLWEVISGPDSFTIIDADKEDSYFTPGVEGDFEIKLTVKDDLNVSASTTQTIPISAVNIKPTALFEIYDPEELTVITQVELNEGFRLKDAGSSDDDGTIALYSWTPVNGAGAPVGETLEGPALTEISLQAGDSEMTLYYRLIVYDNDGEASDPLIKSINVVQPNQDPVVSIVADSSDLVVVPTGEGEQVFWAGNLYTTSSDSDGDELTYQWSTTSPSNVTFTSPNDKNTSFAIDSSGSFYVEITVDDGKGGVASDNATITAVAVNQAPVAIFDYYDTEGIVIQTQLDPSQLFMLKDKGSSDADGTISLYTWERVSAVGESIAGPWTNSVGTLGIMAPDSAATLYFKFIVTDNDGLQSAPYTKSIEVIQPNQDPTVTIDANTSDLSLYGVWNADNQSLSWSGNLYATSSDLDNDSLTYQWTTTSPGSVTFTSPTAKDTAFTINAAGSFNVEISVDDGNGGVATDDRDIVAISNQPPVITLNGASSMTVDQGAVFNDPLAIATDMEEGDLTSSIVVSGWDYNTDDSGDFIITYNVSDSLESPATTVTRSVTVNQVNQDPVAAIDLLTTVEGPYVVGMKLDFSGEESSDPENGGLSYSWTLSTTPAGSTSSVHVNDDAPHLIFFTPDTPGDYVLDLEVEDEGGATGSATYDGIKNVVHPNSPPTPVVTYNQNGGDLFTFGEGGQANIQQSLLTGLSYEFSFDPEDTGGAADSLNVFMDNNQEILLTYETRFVQVPAQSGYKNIGSEAINPVWENPPIFYGTNYEWMKFKPDEPGEYILEITVRDLAGAFTSISVQFNVD